MKTLSLLLLSVAAFAQAPPACLSGPVTVGSVTVNCIAIDNSDYAVASDAGNFGHILHVRVTSTDPEVVGVKITLSYQISVVSDPKQQAPTPATRTVLVAKTESGFLYTFNLFPVYNAARALPLVVTTVQVQEVKPSSSQAF